MREKLLNILSIVTDIVLILNKSLAIRWIGTISRGRMRFFKNCFECGIVALMLLIELLRMFEIKAIRYFKHRY